jgi:hypothetical protein
VQDLGNVHAAFGMLAHILWRTCCAC